METKNMLYIVSEYANQGEIFGELFTFYSNAFSSMRTKNFKMIQFGLKKLYFIFTLLY